jgi:hypothetical protein
LDIKGEGLAAAAGDGSGAEDGREDEEGCDQKEDLVVREEGCERSHVWFG